MESKVKFNGSKDELSKIFNLYKLNVLDVQHLKDGIINTSYRLEIKDGLKLVLRVYQNDNKSNEGIERELDFMDEMRKSGIPVPLVIDNVYGKRLTLFKDSTGKEWQVIVMEFAEGKHLKPTDFDVMPKFAEYQARMHLVSEKLKNNSDISNFKAMADWMRREFNKTELRHLSKEIFGKIEEIYTELKKDIDSSYSEILILPFGEVHLDYDSENVIVDDGKIKAILDFDDISCQPFILDIANSIWWWLFKNDQEDYKKILNSYFESYRKTRNITEEETKFLNLFLRMRNLTLICLLYVNIPEEPRYEKINQGVILDPLLKDIKI